MSDHYQCIASLNLGRKIPTKDTRYSLVLENLLIMPYNEIILTCK